MASKKSGKKSGRNMRGGKFSTKKGVKKARRDGSVKSIRELSIFTYIECRNCGTRYPKGESCPECP